jgi:hypothetical protein
MSIDDFLMDLYAIVEGHEIDVDITLQFGTSENRIKPCGNITYGRMIDRLCRCGCKLKTDGTYIWCSGITCDVFKEK